MKLVFVLTLSMFLSGCATYGTMSTDEKNMTKGAVVGGVAGGVLLGPIGAGLGAWGGVTVGKRWE